MMLTISSRLVIRAGSVPPEALEELQERLTFRNPAWMEAKARLRAMGRPHARPQVPELIRGYSWSGGDLVVPRGVAGEVIRHLGARPEDVRDLTRRLPEVGFGFSGHLQRSQEPVVEAIMGRRFCTVCSPTGSGKTVMALCAIARRRQPALVVVHTSALARQWAERASAFLGMDPSEIGMVGQGSRAVGRRLTIALVQTLRKVAGEVAPRVGHLVVDECHHAPASTFTEAISQFDSAFALGLSATHRRRDGLEALMYWHVGPLAYEVGQAELVREGVVVPVRPVFRETSFMPGDRVMEELALTAQVISDSYRGVDTELTSEQRGLLDRARDVRARLISELAGDQARNRMIAMDVEAEAESGPCIVLTDRKEHAEALASMIRGAAACHGGVPRSEQQERIKALGAGRLRVLVATGQLLGEGFDCRELTALFLATPIRFSGRLKQYLGRVCRSSGGKTHAKVYDYVDVNVPTLVNAARGRAATYRKLARQTQGPTPVIKGE